MTAVLSGMGVIETLDGEDMDSGIGMTPQSRAALMAKLAEGHNAGTVRCRCFVCVFCVCVCVCVQS